MADTLDLLTLAEAREELGLATGYTTQIEAWVTAISRRIDQLCGPVVNRTITNEVQNGSNSSVLLAYRPVVSVTSVTEYWGTTATTLTAETTSSNGLDSYLVDPRAGILYRRSSGYDYRYPQGRFNVAVTYVAGRAANTASVDPLFKQAARVCLRHLWRNENSTPTQVFSTVNDFEDVFRVPTFAIPRAALELLAFELIGAGSTPTVA